MSRVTYLPDAEEDLHRIWRYVYQASGSPEIADRVIARIDDAASTFSTHPLMGELRPDLAPAVRCFAVGSYVVFYVPIDDGMEVIQVIHGMRDIPLHFRRPPT